jgi:hypothetical protein
MIHPHSAALHAPPVTQRFLSSQKSICQWLDSCYDALIMKKGRLKLHGSVDPSGRSAELEQLERCVARCQAGDLREHMQLARKFRPLIRTLAEKRVNDPSNVKEINRLSSLGREGLYEAVLEYNPKIGIARFRVFALDYIERAMDSKPKGFWQRLFRKRFPR